MIYLDNAATSFHKPPQVARAVAEAFSYVGNAGRGGHGATLDTARMIFNTRMLLAELLHAESPECIAFTANATESLNIAIHSLIHSGEHVITTVCEHNSVLRPLYRKMDEENVSVTFVPLDKHYAAGEGLLDYDILEQSCRKNTKALVVTHASNLTGNLTDLARISHFAKAHGLLLIVDGAQTAGCVPVDVWKMGIDVFCFSGHKGLLGPQGTGGIYIREGLDISPLKVGGSGVHSFDRKQPPKMPDVLEAGTQNAHGIAGLGAALEYIVQEDVENIRAKQMMLCRQFIGEVSDIEGITLYGNPDLNQRIATVALNMGDLDSAYVADWLWENAEIAVRAGAHCAPLMHESLGTKKQGAVRFSFSHMNTPEEIHQAVEALKRLAERQTR